MGHPKALTPLPPRGEPALARLVATCEAAGFPQPLVVVGAHAARIRAALPALAVDWVVNDAPDAGRTGSLQRALDAAPTLRAALVWPVDHPLASAGTLRRLADASAPLAVPVCDGRGGHPVRVAGAALDEARAMPPDAPLRDLFRRHVEFVERLEVHDLGVLLNLDTPEDLRALNPE